MGRFWNFRTQLVGVLVLVLSGTFLLQAAIHEHNEQQLLQELETVAQEIANETGELISRAYDARMRDELRLEKESRRDPRLIPVVTFRMERSAPGRLDGRVRAPVDAPQRPGTVTRGRVVLIPIQKDLPEDVVAELKRQVKQMERSATAERTALDHFLELVQRSLDSSPAPTGDLEMGTSPSGVFGLDTPSLLSAPGSLDARTVLAESVAPSLGEFDLESETLEGELDITPHLDRVRELFNDSKRHDLIATVGVFLIGIALAWFLGGRVTRPVDDVVQGFQRLAEGNFETRVQERPGGEFVHLGRRFNDMVERLREAREFEKELSQRERVQHMGDLAAGVAHDVRNPLNAIHLNIGQIRDEFIPENERSKERFLRFTSDVQREVERLNLLVTNFLSLAQPAAEEAEAVDPNELVEELFRLLRKEATGRHIELTLDLAERLPTVNWVRQDLKSAFLNIALNAMQALAAHGGRLVVATGLREGREGPELVVSFTDDGPGISPEDLERVFVPYFTTREGGTGLGMAIARRTAERHGGRVELRSALDEGTSVAFVFSCPTEGSTA